MCANAMFLLSGSCIMKVKGKHEPLKLLVFVLCTYNTDEMHGSDI